MRLLPLLVSALLGGSAASSIADSSTTTAENRAQKLIHNARALPDIDPGEAEVAARAALLVESPSISAELLVAIAWGESRFKPSTVTGRACGLVQVVTDDPRTCRLLQIPAIGLLFGRMELEGWLRAARGDLQLALLANACGVSAFDGSCSKAAWSAWVLARAARLRLPVVGPRS